MCGNTVCGTREALHLASPLREVRTVNPRGTTVMHGCRESDSFIVPRKPSNKGCPQGPAEEVEGRELAKGNVAVHSRDRTQGRVTPVTRARLRTAGTFGGLHVRPKAGARCGSAARRDLCGGRPVRVVPTATFHGKGSEYDRNRVVSWDHHTD